MKLSVGYMSKAGDEVVNEEVILEELDINDGVELKAVVDWYYKYLLELPQGYDETDIVTVIRP